MKFNMEIWILVSAMILSGCSSKQEQKTEDKQKSIVRELSGNPIIKDQFTADPAAISYNDTLWLYTGHDEQVEGVNGFLMNDWLLYSTTDMVNWQSYGAVLQTDHFDWASGQAWAAHVVEKGGKFYWYVTLEHGSIPGKSVGVAVSDSPKGPWTDAIGKALITNDMTTQTDIGWDDIDPAVFIDQDGSAYIYWGNTVCKWAKLKDNMIELDGEIHTIELPSFTEAPWVHKRGEKYYLSYASQFPEVIDYAMADSPEGPWEYKGRLNDLVPNSPTNHQSIVEYKSRWYFIYHNGKLPGGGEFRRSVCIENLEYNPDGTIQKIEQTIDGVSAIQL